MKYSKSEPCEVYILFYTLDSQDNSHKCFCSSPHFTLYGLVAISIVGSYYSAGSSEGDNLVSEVYLMTGDCL